MVGRKLKDDRGVTRYAMSTTQTDRVIKDRQLQTTEVFCTVLDTMAARHRRLRFARHAILVIAGLLVVLFFVSSLMSFSNTSQSARTPIETTGPFVILLLFVFLIVYKRFMWIRNDLRPFALCKLGYCTCCGYPLEGLTPEPDGCTVCPECGAAWRMPTGIEATDA